MCCRTYRHASGAHGKARTYRRATETLSQGKSQTVCEPGASGCGTWGNGSIQEPSLQAGREFSSSSWPLAAPCIFANDGLAED